MRAALQRRVGDNGGARRDRTADLLRARQALSQLSYGPVTCLFFAWRRWLFAHLVMYQLVHSRRSLTSRLASQKKSCVTTSFVGAENSITVLFNPNFSPFFGVQGGVTRRIVRYASGAPTPKSGKWWVWEDLNFRPHPYQGCALTN